MAAVETVEIVNEKDPSKKSIINLSDFDASKHTKWEDRDKHPAHAPKPEEYQIGSAHEPKSDKPPMSGSKK